MNPISAPLARSRDVKLVGERLAVRNTTLSDTNGTIVPGCLIVEHAMVVERAGSVKVVGRMNDEGVIRADGNWRRTVNLNKIRKREGGREKTNGQVPLTPIARLGTPKPSGLTS